MSTNMVSISLPSPVTTLHRSPLCSSTSLVLPSSSGRSSIILMSDMEPGYTKLIPTLWVSSHARMSYGLSILVLLSFFVM